MDYSNWNPDAPNSDIAEPNEGGKDCAAMDPWRGKYWRDEDCTQSHAYICQIGKFGDYK